MSTGYNEKVAVLIIAYKEALSDYEKISLQQCLNILKNYTIIVVKPEHVNISSWQANGNKLKFESFPDQCFRDVGTYSRLLLSKNFYRRFIQFEYILIYQLDAFVFKDDLESWCNKQHDFIGAPWFEGFSNDEKHKNLVGVGNGGLSLRKVSSHIKALNSFSYLVPPQRNWHQRFRNKPKGTAWLHEAAGFLLDLTVRNNTFYCLNSFMGYEDQFWGIVVANNFKWFKLPDCQEAMEFSFEMQPGRLFEMNERQLPFGCHAWWKYDVEFWKPYIQNFGYTL